jgi:hypothetical protein
MRNLFLIFIAEMMSDTDSLSKKCVACYRWVINGLICTDCLWLLLPLKLCNHQPQCTRQEERIRHLEKELKAAREEICKLKARNVSSNFMEQDNSGNWKKKKKTTPGPIGSLQMMLVKFN